MSVDAEDLLFPPSFPKLNYPTSGVDQFSRGRSVKLPTSGVAFQNLPWAKRRLTWIAACAAREFNRDICFSPEQCEEIIFRLSLIVGSSQQKAERPDAKQVASFLRSKSKSAQALQTCFSLSHVGFVEISSAEAAGLGLLVKTLAQAPDIGSPEKAHEFLEDLRDRCATLAHACDIAAEHPQSLHGGKGGAPKLDWYDEFTRLVVELCERYGLSTSPGRDREEGTPDGQFYRMAEVMEKLLPLELQSNTAETRHDRLGKSLKRIS